MNRIVYLQHQAHDQRKTDQREVLQLDPDPGLVGAGEQEQAGRDHETGDGAQRRQAPVGIRVTHRAFGRDWRYPITSKYRE